MKSINGTGQKKLNFSKGREILFGLMVFSVVWFIVQRQGIGQKQDIQENWSVETHDKTNFPLVGKHRTTSCRECHLNLVFEGTPRECEACHWERRQDDRYQLKLGIHCGECHTPFTWKNVSPNKWNHSAVTGFELKGVHRTFDCADCHGEEGFMRLRVDCFECHEEEYRESDDPNHEAAGFPYQCQLCHLSQSTWSGAVFSHDTYILKGRHKVTTCSNCHSSGQYAGLFTECVSCHFDDYNNADDPDHKGLGFPTDCEICHGNDSASWEGAKFAHAIFPLKGEHRLQSCSACHGTGQYAGLSTECVSCHLDDYNGTDDPDHEALNFPTDCEICHDTSAKSWDDATFNHSLYWILQGAHTKLDCSSCHAQGYNLPRDCYGCHVKDYDTATDPNHKTAGFPTDCEICHYPTHLFWSQAVFDHEFPIGSGKHSSADCTDCHVSSNYKDFSCFECHTHNKTRMDNEHQGVAGYVYQSQACYACHPQGKD